MKKSAFCFCFVIILIITVGFNTAQAINVTIIESTSFNAGHLMDSKWQTECTAMGYTSSIMPQTTLDNTAFFATTDILIISSGVINLPANRRQTIVDFVQSGKPAYIQGEYLPSYDANLAYKNVVDSTGDSFTIGVTVSGTLAPMNVLGTFATTPNAIAPLTYFWYGNTGSGTNITYFLEYGGNYFGFFHCPSNPAWGSVCQTTDQDWINSSTQPLLMRNILYHLQNCSSPFSMTVSPNVAICQGQSTTLTATGGGTYLWSNTQTTASIVVSPGTTTTYSVTVTNGGNSGTGSVTVTVNPIPTVTATAAPSSICAGQSSVLTAAGATTYSWMPGSLSGTSVTVTPGTTTTYTVTGTGAGGCTNTATVTVTVNPIPTVTASASPPAICSGQSSVLTGTGANTYSWMPGSLSGTAVTVTPGTTTTYTVTGTGTGGCTNTATVTVTVTSSVVPSVSISAVPSGIICSGTSVTFTATPTNGGTTPSYQWQVNGSNAGTNSPTYTSSSLNNGDVITVIMTSNSPCASPTTATSNSITMVVSSVVVPAVSIAAVPSGSICAGTSVTFTATPTNGGTTPSYQWQVNGANVGINSDTYTSATLNNGDVITVILTSNEPCASPTTATSNSITLVVTPSVVPAVSITVVPTGTICAGTSVTFTATPTNGGTTPSYQWQVNGVNAGTNSPTFTSNTLNNGDVITVILTSNAPCAVPATATSNSITMTVDPAPTANITPANPSYCAGGSVALSASGGTTYAWSPSTGLSCTNCQNPTANPTSTTTYTLTVSNGTCTATSSVTVTVNAIPVANITGDLTICTGMPTTLTASGGSTYSWSSGETTAVITVSPTSTTGYTVTVSNGGCTATDAVSVQVYPIPVANAGPDTTIIINAMIQLHGTGGTSYSWYPPDALSCTNCPDPYASPEETTVYILTVTNAAGCSDTDTITVYVDMECGEVWIPSAFSPNNDGRNDVLFVRGNCIKTMSFCVYDRWGEKVFESTDPGFGWDGKLRDKPMNPGVFMYCLKAVLFTDQEIVKKGNVTLVR